MSDIIKSKKLISLIAVIAVLLSSLGFASISNATVSKEPRLNVRTLYMTKDSTYKLRVYNTKKSYSLNYSSSDNNIVYIKKSISKSCRLKSKSSGTAYITANVLDESNSQICSLKCKVIVSPPAISVKFSKNKLKINQGDTKRLTAVVKPNVSSEQPRYSSDNTKIASVSSTGYVTAISAGQTIVRASISNGKEDTFIVIVSSTSKNSTDNNDLEESNSPTSSAAPDNSIDDSSTTESKQNDKNKPTYSPATSEKPVQGNSGYYYNNREKPDFKVNPFLMGNDDNDSTTPAHEDYVHNDEYEKNDAEPEHTDLESIEMKLLFEQSYNDKINPPKHSKTIKSSVD